MDRSKAARIPHLNFGLILGLTLMFSIFACSNEPAGDGDLSSLNALIGVEVAGHPEIYSEIDKVGESVEMLIPFHSTLDVSAIKLKLSVSRNATTNIDPFIEYDLSEPIDIEVSAEDNSIAVFTLHAKKCEGGKSAVIVSDTQNDIIPLYRQDAFFKNANIVLDKAFTAGIPIYYVMLTSLKGTSAWDLPSQLHYYDNGKIVDKDDVFDSFETTSLHKEFLSKGISNIYVIGVSSMGCVLGTCKGSVMRKYQLILVSDAHSEPIGYRTEASIDECNEEVRKANMGELVKAADLDFRVR